MTDDGTPAVQLVGLHRHFGDVRAVDGVDLTISDSEFFSMLGPSGSGKTTVLRLIAGFDVPSGGAVLLHGRDVTNLAPYDRHVNTVFQDYALFPHMNVQRNVEYGLKVKGVARRERENRAQEMLDAVRLSGFGSRKPNQLSGGQRQRVALARALVNQPKVLLLDEPLGALDLKLREEMQVELKTIQREVGITFIFVTHDQGEALSMSDRIAVFNHGRVEQVGTPREVYERPASAFVANFVGTSNLLPDGGTVRPERVRITSAGLDVGENSASATVVDVQYLGSGVRVHTRTAAGHSMIASIPTEQLGDVRVGEDIILAWPASAVFAGSTTISQGGNR